MDFRHLEYFVEIAAEKNITRAAKKLYVSQSAVNQYLLKLEKELDTQMFMRVPGNWQLTEAGKVYLEGCRKALLIRRDTFRRIADITGSRANTLCVGLTPGRGIPMFTAVYPLLHQKFPSLHVTPREMDARSQIDAVGRGEIDLAFIVRPDPVPGAYVSVDLGQEEMVVMAPREIPDLPQKPGDVPAGGDGLPRIDLRLLSKTSFILPARDSTGAVHREVCDRIFASAGISPEILMETSSSSHVIAMAQTCRCCCIVPRYYAGQASTLHCFALADHPSWHLYLCFRRGAYLTPAAKEYVRLAKQYWRDHLALPEAGAFPE